MNPLMMAPGALSGTAGAGMAGLAGLGGGMNPLALMALIQGGGTLANTFFSGLLGGAGIGEERKYKEGIWKEKQKLTKPSQPFYMTPYLAGYDKVLMKAVLSNLSNKGQGYEGLDLEKIMQLMAGAGGGQQRTQQPQPQMTGKFANLAGRY